MTSSTKRVVVALVLCAVVDIAAGPAILATAEPGEALRALAFVVPALGVLTASPPQESLAVGDGPSRSPS